MAEIQLPYLSYEDVRQIASDFLAEHFPSLSIPIPIELIAERDLGVDIVPCPGLQSLRGIDAFISRDGTEIRIDAGIYLGRGYRHRFSIAEEIGHLHLHFGRMPSFGSFEDWLEFRERLSVKTVNRAECQAKDFAGLVLVPPSPLRAQTSLVYSELSREWGQGFSHDDAVSEEFWNALVYEVAEFFEVSPQTAQIRLVKDNLWCTQL